MSEKVEIVIDGHSVEVDHEFYRVATGILTMGLPIMDVFRNEGEDFASIVFPDSDSMEFFSGFLLTHNLFVDGDDPPSVSGGFQLEMLDGELSPTYLINVDDRHLQALESCLVAHTPSLSTVQN